ncbi:MAG: hypothetical protein JWM53_617 [bacterium]|nr:hypothetical protein [bacterium]
MTPLETILERIERQPPEVRAEIKGRVVMLLPPDWLQHGDESDDLDGPPLFDARIAGKPAHVGAATGVALLLSTIIDFVMIGRDTRESWRTTRDLLERMIADGNAAGKPAPPSANEMLLKHDLNSRRWIRAADEWKELRSSSVSVSAIRSWMADTVSQGYMSDDGDDLNDDHGGVD